MNLVFHDCPPRPCSPTLSAGDVHIWSVPLAATSDELGELSRELTPEEQARAARYRAGRIREQFIAGRGFLRRILGSYLGTIPREVPIGYELSGKPMLLGSDLRFNLTHTDGLALVAVSGRRVGVDLERVRDVPNAEGLVQRFFSAAECEAYRRLQAELRPTAFFRGWTCKEAVIKAAGASIESLQAFDVELHPERPPTVLAARHPTIGECRWTISTWNPGEGFAAAVAVEER